MASERPAEARSAASGAADPAEDLRARALQRLLPPLVHELNNGLALVRGTHEAGARAPLQERQAVSVELGEIAAILAQLSLLARPPARQVQPLAVADLLERVERLVRPLAARHGVRFEQVSTAGVLELDGRLEALLTSVCAAWLVEAAGEGRERRLCLRAAPGRGRLRLVLAGTQGGPEALGALAALAREHGWGYRLCRRPHALGVRLTLPAAGVAQHAPQRRARRQHVLLLAREGAEREELTLLLREHGCRVSAAERAPSGGTHDLALVAADLVRADPGLLERLRASGGPVRVALLTPRLRPAEILGLLRD